MPAPARDLITEPSSYFDRIALSAIGLLVLLIVGVVWLRPGVQAVVEPASSDKPALHLVYTAVDAQTLNQLFVASLVLSNPPTLTLPIQPLTAAPVGVWDYGVAPAGNLLVCSALTAKGTSDLWLTTPYSSEATLLVACPDAACGAPAWSPDGNLLAFSRRSNVGGGTPTLNPPRLWLLDVKSGEMAPVFGDSQKLAFDARWSGDGKWLSYLSPDFGGVGVLNLESGQMQFYETPTGETGVWHPKRNQVLISVLRQIGEQYVTHLLLIDPVSSEQRNLSSEDALVEDSSAVWSPDGKWIAFRRRWLEGEAATLSRQLWRMRSYGSEAKPLTASDEFEHGAPVWTPDGNYLVYHKFPLKVPAITLSIWAMDVESGQQWELVNPGQRPLIIQQQTALADLKLCLTQHTNLLY